MSGQKGLTGSEIKALDDVQARCHLQCCFSHSPILAGCMELKRMRWRWFNQKIMRLLQVCTFHPEASPDHYRDLTQIRNSEVPRMWILRGPAPMLPGVYPRDTVRLQDNMHQVMKTSCEEHPESKTAGLSLNECFGVPSPCELSECSHATLSASVLMIATV